MKDDKCSRCGGEWEHRNFENTFWGAVKTITTTLHEAQTLGKSWNGDRRQTLVTDETNKLCADCWSLLVGGFLRGKAIAAIRGEGEQA